MALGYGRVGTNQFACSKFIVDANGLDKGATHTTLTAALGVATSGDTIFVKPSLPLFAAYDEDITLKSGVNIIGFNGDGFSEVQAQILGKITLGAASDCSVKNLQIKTDGDYCIEDTGASTGSIRFLNCTLKLDSTGGINLNNANRTLTFHDCQIGRGLSSIKDFNVTSCESLAFEYCIFSGAITVAVSSTIAAGTFAMRFCRMNRHAVVVSGTAIAWIDFVCATSDVDNLITFDFTAATTHLVKHLAVQSGTAAGINIGAGVTVKGVGLTIESSNADAISGTGTLVGPGAEFFGSSSVIASGLTWDTGGATKRELTISHTATENDDHALEIDCNTGNFGDVKALDIVYTAGIVQATDDEECILINIDETASTGGQIAAVQVLTTTEGSAAVIALKSGPGIDAIRNEVGTFGDMGSALNKAVDVKAALVSGGAGNISVFVADDDTFTIGHAASFGAMEIIVGTGASGAGISPVFEYSTGVGTWASFSPADGTNSFKNTGVIEWDVTDLAGFAVGTGSEFLIRITRTRNTLATTPIIDEVQISALTEFVWDSSGDLTANEITLTNPLPEASGGTHQSTYTQGDVLYSSSANTLSKLPLGTATQVLKVNAGATAPEWAAAAGGGAWTLISTATASDDATVVFTSLSSTYFLYRIVIDDLLPETGGSFLWLRTSTDNGVGYDSGASDYAWVKTQALMTTSPGLSSFGDDADVKISVSVGLSATVESAIILDIVNPSQTNFTKAIWTGTQSESIGSEQWVTGSGQRLSAADVDAIQFLFSADNIATGTFKLYGLAAT